MIAPAPGTCATFVLGGRDTPTQCEVISAPRSWLARGLHGAHEWHTVLVRPDGETEARPVCVSRWRP
jgi:hypothetical protein